MRLLLLADTHLPIRAKMLPAQVWQEVAAADVVVHAGDWVSLDLYEELLARAERLVGVWGNNDGAELRSRMPKVARVELEGLRLGVVHETGAATGRERRADAAYGPASASPVDVLVFGHSHIPWDTTTDGGVRLLNPGSPTDRRRQPNCTYLTAGLADGALTEVVLHRLPRLGRADATVVAG